MENFERMKRYVLLGVLVLVCYFGNGQTQRISPLNRAIEEYLKDKNAVVGVTVTDTNGNVVGWINGNAHFPMQSVFKFHIAMVMLSEIDKGHFALDQKVDISKKELLPDTWSPIRDQYPNGTSLTIGELISYTVSLSDNNGCDILLRLLGGPKTVEDFFKSKGYPNISIKINEAQMHQGWEPQFQNWITPSESNRILYDFFKKDQKFLSASSKDFLLKVMIETETGMNRLKGKLPEGTVVAHKTGSSGANSKGVTAAANDIGVVYLPNGNAYLISVFVSQSTENETVNDEIIAQISLIAWEYFTKITE